MLAGGENGFHILIGQFPARVGFEQNFIGHGLPLVLGQIIGRVRGFIAPAQSFEPCQQRPVDMLESYEAVMTSSAMFIQCRFNIGRSDATNVVHVPMDTHHYIGF